MKNKKILLGAVAVILAVILLITGICINVNKKNKGISISTQELARAMSYEQFKEGDEAVDGTDNVKFSAFFLRDLDGDGYAEKIKGTCKEIGAEDTMYMEINVQTEGYLKDAKIEIAGENFYLQTALPKDEQLKDNYIGSNIKLIEFNELNNGTQKLITGVVRSGDYSYKNTKNSAIGNNINNYSRTDNKIILTGTHVGEGGTETEIRKEIELIVDWYGKTKAEITSANQNYKDLPERIDEENGTIKLSFEVKTNETEGKLNLSKNYVEGTIPELNGYAATEVKMTNTTSENLTFVYDEDTKTFTIERTGVVSEDGTIETAVARNNTYNLEVTYPIKAYQSLGEDTVSIKIPVKTNYEGHNNQNTEFTNPYKSNTASTTIVVNYERPQGSVANFEIKVGKNIYNPTSRYIVSKEKTLKIYNGISEKETEDTYTVRWSAYTGTNGETTGLVMKETKDGEDQVKDKFIKTDATEESMENITRNIGIYITGADEILKEEGWIKVYDEETGNLLVTFTKEDWSKYTALSPYKYELPVKHIRIETSETNKESGIYVYNIKELNDEKITTKYTREEFDNLEYIKSTLNGYLGGNHITTVTHEAKYEEPYSIATIGISKNTISTQGTEEHERITINAEYNSNWHQIGWVDGSFLVKLPEGILTVEINSVEISNTNVTITSYELIENEEGKFIKINTQNNNYTAQSYRITIDTNITPDPRRATETGTIELYATNEEISEYYYKGQDIYDVNNNLNTEEIVNKATTSIDLVSPNSLLTNQTASEYDAKNSIVISPQIAEIQPKYVKVDNEKQTAKIGVQLTNNYASTISEVVILGKIPFEGNSTVLSGKELNSEFATKMLETGIEIPEELQGKVKIYYSENENPDKDLNNKANGWILAENVINWECVKTFLIDFQDEILETGEEYTFYYKVEIPDGIEFNKTSYSHHGVYFSLDTEEGKYRTQTEPNKLGLRIVEKYNLELIKTQKGKEKTVSRATYSIKEVLEDGTIGETKTEVTNENGTLIINDLYAEKTYEIQEIKSPNDYELNSDIIRFTSHILKDGTLTIEKLQGETKEDIAVTKNEGEKHKVTVKVEDEAKARLKITKVEQGTENTISYVKYRMTGHGLPSNGRILTTNTYGEIEVKGLKINEEYTLEETKASGYYLVDPIKFKIVNNEGTYSVETIEGTIAQNTVTEEDSLPTANLILENEKIPTYTLEISKIKKVLETELTETEREGDTTQEQEVTYLAGAKFKLYKDEVEIGTYITDANGKITIENLYQYIEERDEQATYTLKEVIAPQGYAKVKDITFKVQNTDGELTFINTEGKEEKYEVEGTTVKLTIEDSPSFKLIKKDGETGEALANIKFAIYNVDGVYEPARNSKGEVIGTLETIDGQQYYTVTTDSKGAITVDLPEGYYKAVELQAPDKYDIQNKTYYFGIGGSREAKKELQAQWAKAIGGSSEEYINSVVETSDGGYIVGGYFTGNSIDLGNGVTLTNNSSSSSYRDGMLIKYSEEGNIEWAKAIGGDQDDAINSVVKTREGGYIVGGYFEGNSIDLGNGIILTNSSSFSSYSDGMLIKYSAEGNVEWAKAIGGSSEEYINSVIETRDGGYIVGGYFHSTSIDLGNGVELTNHKGTGSNDGMIIKYNEEGEAQWGKAIGGSHHEYIYSVVETRDGGYIVAGGFYDSIDLGNGVTLTNNGSTSCYDGMLIKYSAEGVAQWAKAIGGDISDSINSVVETSDGGYIVGGYFASSSIDLGNGVELTNHKGTGSNDGMLIKYNAEGNVEWAKAIGGDISDSINSVVETSDGGYLVGGEFDSESIKLGNGVTLTNNSSKTNYRDGMIIKYNEEGVVQWAKGIGGDNSDSINSVIEISDGGYLVGGKFASEGEKLGNGVTLTSGGMIIKYETEEVPEVIVEKASAIGGSSSDSINSVVETRDGGYIVAGVFYDSIDLGNGVTLSIDSSYCDGMIIKYNAEGVAQWAKAIGGDISDSINSVVETSDGGYIVGGYFASESIDLGKGITLTTNGDNDGMLIKYNAEGNVEWAKAIGGDISDSINSVVETSDGGYLVGGEFDSESIKLGNGVTLASNGSYDGMIIKYSAEGNVEWAKGIGGDINDSINSVIETRDGGYIVGGRFSGNIDLGNGIILTNSYSSTAYDGMIIKYSAEGKAQWAKAIGGSSYWDSINSVIETRDGGYVTSGEAVGVIKYNESGEEEWSNTEIGTVNSVLETKDGGYILVGGGIIKCNGLGDEECSKKNIGLINSVIETKDGSYIVGGSFSGSRDLGNNVTLTSTGYSDGMVIKISMQMGVPEVQELTVENMRKEFKITTNVKKVDGIKGGTISGEHTIYETVKYGDNTTKEIVMTPDENYEIIRVTINREEHSFTPNEDDTYTMPVFTNMTEDKYIEVTYALKDNKMIINKVDSETKATLSGATFKLDQIEEREVPESTIGTLTNNGQEYIEPDLEKEVTDALGELTDNGKGYNVTVDTTTEVEDVLGELTNNGTYYFVEQDGKYVPTNSKTYQVANGGTAGKASTTANSYIKVDLTNKTGDYVVVVNANVSSQQYYDYGYANITETTSAPANNVTTGRFISISGTSTSVTTAKDYTSMALEGGKIYYLHLGYYKNYSRDTGKDQIEFNSVKVYEATCTRYNFVENGGRYESNNQGQSSTTANSYIPIDLSNKTGQYALVVNAYISSQRNYDYGYATVTEDTTRPSYSNSTGRFIYISGITARTDYTTLLEGGKVYYLHLGYYKDSSTDVGNDKFTVNSVNLYETKTVTYGFAENEGKYESTIQGRDSRMANSYIPIDLTDCEGTYNIIVNAKISSDYGDYGYATITEDTTAPAYDSSTGRFIYVSGYDDSEITPTDYTTVVEGGKIYYLHLGYYKNNSMSEGEDKFTINSIIVTPNPDDLYHTEVTTNSEGKGTTQIPFGKYSVTEITAPDGYELNENSVVIEFRDGGNHEFTFENSKLAKVIVHHYLKDTTTKVAEDDILQDKAGYPYTAVPKLDLEKYELEKAEDGSYIIPENVIGQYIAGEQEVIYYYEEKEIPLVVNHYIEGTETSVSLINGEKVQSSISYGNAAEEYTTEPISSDQLNEEYELVEMPSNSVGTYEGNIVEVTYYYKKVVRNVVINKYQEDGVTPLEGAKFTILGKGEEIIKEIVETEEIQNNGQYYFEKQGNKYVSNNQYADGTTANSYIKIDLTKTNENVDLTVNAEVSSETNYDFGYATITETTAAPSYNNSTGRFIYISGTVSAQDYTRELEEGKVYYLHLGYRKDSSSNSGTDTFTINSIKLNGLDYSEYIGGKVVKEIITEYTTDSKGKIETTLEAGDYIITEIEAPEGYQLPENPSQEITISKDLEEISLDIINLRKQGRVIVHHYIENSTVPVLLADGTQAQDIVKTGAVGDMYVSKDLENVDSRFTVVGEPSNASGNITEEDTEVIYYYSKPEVEAETTIEKKATDKITSKDTKVYYEVKFTGKINWFDGNAKLKLVDTLPYPIIVEESELAGGKYDAETKTITWEEEINNLEALESETIIERTKILNLKYNYENINETTGKMENKVNSTLELLEPSEENLEEYVIVKEDKQETVAETLVEIPTEVKVHHYIYDAEKNEYTTVKLAEDETIEGIIGQEYTTVSSTEVANNYSCINQTPENYEGRMTEEVIQVNYYYQLATPTIENTMNKTASANKADNNGVAILTKEDGIVTYNFRYNVRIKDYIGKATVEIVDSLPAGIDVTKSDLSGGAYNAETNTITWTETIEGIDTYANGEYSNNITKEIKVVYVNQDFTNYIVNTVVGNVKVYYPEAHTTKSGEELANNTARDNEALAQEYKATLKVEKVWEDNNDLKGKRPESVTIVIKGIPNEDEREVLLNAENGWVSEITDLPKYDAEGNKIAYEVTERETVVNDLEYYELPEITMVENQTEELTNYVFTVENAFKLMETDLKAEITKQGSEEITSSKQEVEYTINFKAEVIDYIGEGKVKIVDTLPYKIDEEKSSLAEGIYDDETQTITWEEELPHINTDVSGESYKVDITKQIKVVYKDIDLTQEKMTNTVNGKVELYETEVKDEKETLADTNINVNGKVIVRYVDKDSGEDIDTIYNYEIVEKVGTEYNTEKKEIENYDYIESTNNETGIMTEETQEVIYYYSRMKTSVLVKYQDVEGNELLPEVLINGQVLDTYTTEQKDIENYRFVGTTGDKEGTMTKEQMVVIYMYEKIPSKVIVKYLEKVIVEVDGVETEEEKEIVPAETIEGYAGEEYITERKVIQNYRKAEPEPENKTGKMTEEEIEVKYYYEKIPSGKITVKYVDIDTEEEIMNKEIKEDGTEEEKTYRYEIIGFVGEEYETEEKEIPYYMFINSTENIKGILTEKDDIVTYYYRKLDFNFSVEKTIEGISLNGEEVKVEDNKLAKIEIKTSQVEEANLEVSYRIKVRNEGEIKGKANITEIIPEGYEVIEKADYWTARNGVIETQVELDVGEEKELIVKLRWINSEDNLGAKDNIVQIRDTENEAGFEEISTEDNSSSATVVISIKTGETIKTIIKVLLTTSFIICLYMEVVLILDIKKGQSIKEIKFLNKK